MSFESIRDNLRACKTKKLIIDAMTSLLERQSFKKMTITDICEGALISRATFYSHFLDKFDLLRYWLVNLLPNPVDKKVTYEILKNAINPFFDQYKRIIKNILGNADSETLHIVTDVIILALGLGAESNSSDEEKQKHTVYSNVFAGGILYHLMWHVENNFPSDVMDPYVYDLIQKFSSWGPDSCSADTPSWPDGPLPG